MPVSPHAGPILGSSTLAVEGLKVWKGATAAKATRTERKPVSHCSRVFDKEGLTDTEMCPFQVGSHQLSVTRDSDKMRSRRANTGLVF